MRPSELDRLRPQARKEALRQLYNQPDELGRLMKSLTAPKYSNKKEEGWDSQGERRYYQMHLLPMQAAGEIRDLQRQVKVPLYVGRDRHMRLDFSYFDCRRGERVWLDWKGYEDPVWTLKRAIWSAGVGPGLLIVAFRCRGGIEFKDYRPQVNRELLRVLTERAAEEDGGA